MGMGHDTSRRFSRPCGPQKEERPCHFKITIPQTTPTSASNRPRKFTWVWVPKANATHKVRHPHLPSSISSSPHPPYLYTTHPPYQECSRLSAPRVHYLAQMEQHLGVEEPKVAVSSLLCPQTIETEETMLAHASKNDISNNTASLHGHASTLNKACNALTNDQDTSSSDSTSLHGQPSDAKGRKKQTRRGTRGANRGRSRREALASEPSEVPEETHDTPQVRANRGGRTWHRTLGRTLPVSR